MGVVQHAAEQCHDFEPRSSSKERDAETGLDYFGARYYSGAQGRFISSDPLGGQLADPQTLNRYSYVRNNPLKFTDPTGMYICGEENNCDTDEFQAFERARQNAIKKGGKIARAAKAYGDPSDNNGVTVIYKNPDKGETGLTKYDIEEDLSKPNGIRAKTEVDIRPGLNEQDLEAAIAHEGSQVADAQDFIDSITAHDADYSLNYTQFDYETRAYALDHLVHFMNNTSRPFECGQLKDCRLGVGAGIPTRQIEDHLSKSYGISRAHPGNPMYPDLVPPKATTPRE